MYDFALLKLKNRVETVETKDFLPLCGDMQKTTETDLFIYGFPGSHVKADPDNFQVVFARQCGASGPLLSVNKEKSTIKYFVSTESGESGTAVIASKGNQKVIIGIHKGGVSLTSDEEKDWGQRQANGGRLVTPDLIKFLEVETRRFEAQMFKKQVEPVNLEGWGYDQTTQLLSKVLDREVVQILSITDTVTSN